VRKINRRQFFSMLGNGSIFIALAGTVAFTYKYLFPNVLFEPPTAFKAGNPGDFPEDSFNFIEERKVFVVHDKNGFFAISAVCTHLGCTVRWMNEEKQFHCPCHGSFFSPEGRVKGGPAPRPLDCFAMRTGPDGKLIVDTGKLVDSQTRLEV
jgi:cytochrome b6-f complex iron-sulfur subunit